MTDQYGRPYANPENMSEADAIARKYLSGEIPLPGAIIQDLPEDDGRPEDGRDRYERIIESLYKEEEDARRNPSRPY